MIADYAKRKGIRGSFADILPENTKMKKSLPNENIKNRHGRPARSWSRTW